MSFEGEAGFWKRGAAVTSLPPHTCDKYGKIIIRGKRVLPYVGEAQRGNDQKAETAQEQSAGRRDVPKKKKESQQAED